MIKYLIVISGKVKCLLPDILAPIILIKYPVIWIIDLPWNKLTQKVNNTQDEAQFSGHLTSTFNHSRWYCQSASNGLSKCNFQLLTHVTELVEEQLFTIMPPLLVFLAFLIACIYQGVAPTELIGFSLIFLSTKISPLVGLNGFSLSFISGKCCRGRETYDGAEF